MYQNILFDHEENIGYLQIDEPFYKAGKEFFEKDGPGLGVSLNILKNLQGRNAKIRIFVGPESSKAYEADPSDWLEQCFLYKSIYVIKSKNNLELYVRPWNESYFKTVKHRLLPKIFSLLAFYRLKGYERIMA